MCDERCLGGNPNATYTIPGRPPIGGYPAGEEWRTRFTNPRPPRAASTPETRPPSARAAAMPGAWQYKFSSVKGQPANPNQTYTIEEARNRTYTVDRPMPGREDLAESIMDDIGEGDIWNEASAMSMSDYLEVGDEDYEDLDDVTPDLYQSQIADESFPYMNISEETPPSFPYSNISDETPPFDYSDGCGCDSADDSSDARGAEISALAESPSNISVYDAEELNMTTAPRNADWDIPRNRIWQNISSSLDETEQQEEDSYAEFVAGLQTERRTILDLSPILP